MLGLVKGMDISVLVREGLITLVLFLWVMFVVGPLTKFLYQKMRARGMTHIKAVYYNRKVIHTGGRTCISPRTILLHNTIIPSTTRYSHGYTDMAA